MVGTVSGLKAETLERAPTLLLSEHVQCAMGVNIHPLGYHPWAFISVAIILVSVNKGLHAFIISGMQLCMHVWFCRLYLLHCVRIYILERLVRDCLLSSQVMKLTRESEERQSRAEMEVQKERSEKEAIKRETHQVFQVSF